MKIAPVEEYRKICFELRDHWIAVLPAVPFDGDNLVMWSLKYEADTIKKGMNVTGQWYARKNPKPTANEAQRYASATMRNIHRAHREAEKIFGTDGVL